MQTKWIVKFAVAAVLSAGVLSSSQAQTTNDQAVETLRNTLVNILDALVQKGVLTREQAQGLVADAQAKADAVAKTKAAQDEAEKGAVHVTYVPESVKQEIGKQVSADLKPKVTQEVIAAAKSEKWGVPGALPDWVPNIKLFGDVRARFQNDNFADDNMPYKNYLAINSAGGETKAGNNAFLNTTEDRFRERLRLRLGLNAKITDGVSAGLRLASGSLSDPVSTNQTLGNNGSRYQVGIDQAYLKFDANPHAELPWLTAWVGRYANPFISTDLVWDPDLQFDGVATTLRYSFDGQASQPRHAFFSLAAFPLQEIELSPKDKWMYGGQLGLSWPWSDHGRAVLAGSYYYYDQITGRQNEPGLTLLNYTAPTYMQKGNTVFDILNDTDATTNLYGLSTHYRLLNATLLVELPAFDHLFSLTADYVRNIGYDKSEVLSHFVPTAGVPDDITKAMLGDEQTTGYQIELGFGSQVTGKRGSWRGSMAYKYLERDAVLDAFTDSDFHLGGTNAKGYILRGEWWLLDRTWVTLRYFSTDEIKHYGTTYFDPAIQSYVRPTDSPRLGVDTFMFDINAQF